AILIPAVRSAMAATILPCSAAQPEIAEGSIIAHTVDDSLSRELVLCTSASLPPTPAVEQVIALCKDEIKRLINDQAWQGCVLLE
ncbi:MAG: LysR substrate-binding domain-containing protein, partial [Achromobacter pestifer]